MENMIEYKAEFFYQIQAFFIPYNGQMGGRSRCPYNSSSEAPELARRIMPAKQIIRESLEHPQHRYYINRPGTVHHADTEEMWSRCTPGKGILNIDVLSFQRLAYRIFEEAGGAREVLLDDTGKSMVLAEAGAAASKRNLPYLGSQMNKAGLSGRGEISDFRIHAV